MKRRVLATAAAAIAFATVTMGHAAFAASPEETSTRTNGSPQDSLRDLSAAGSLSFEVRPLQSVSGLRLKPALASIAGLPGLGTVFAPDSALPVATPADPQPGQVTEIGRSPRSPLYQSQCSICLSGTNSIQWSGGSATLTTPQINNNQGSGTSGSLRVVYIVSSTYPVWGSSLNGYQFSGYENFSPLPAGYYYSPVTSGSLACYQASIPAGTYYLLVELQEYTTSGWVYDDFGVDSKQVSCNGFSGCTAIAACVEDAHTMCLGSGRYKVTSSWQNQYTHDTVRTPLQKTRFTDVVGSFWIDAGAYQYFVSVNPATSGLNGYTWVAINTFSGVEFWIDVTDTATGLHQTYHNPPENKTLVEDRWFFPYP